MANRFIVLEALHGNILDLEENRLYFLFFPIPIFLLTLTIQDRLLAEN